MRPKTFLPEALIRLLKRRKIATMEEMKAALGTTVDMTVFRKLREIPYLASYSHRGKYYALKDTARFDPQGVWTFQGVHFSRFGSLVDTAEQFVLSSKQGYLAPELGEKLHVTVHQPLLQLVRASRLDREEMSGQYLYLSPDPGDKQQQFLLRKAEREGSPFSHLSERPFPAEAKVMAILFLSLLDERQRRLYAGLESIKWGRGGDRRVAEWTGLSLPTIARGRRELRKGEITSERIRHSGAGRKPVEKKDRISSKPSFD